MNDTMTTDSPEAMRARTVDRIVAGSPALSGRVAEAMRIIPRHLFLPEASVEEAYADQAVITKSAADGAALSCASVPSIVATMLDQLGVQAGDRILEIGAGTGYNAALLAHLTGPDGQVTTVDIDPEVTDQARRALDATGYRHVHVATRDGQLSDKEHAPYDRIIVTVGAWDLPPPGGHNWYPAGGSWCRCAGEARPAASRSPTSTAGYGPIPLNCAASCPWSVRAGSASATSTPTVRFPCTGTSTSPSFRPPCAESSTSPGRLHGRR